MTQIRWGILGLGHIAHKFAQDLQSLPDASLHAVASTDAQRARNFAAQYGAPHAYGSYEELLNCPDLDVVYIATTHNHHYENTLMCLEGGLAVLCEKPFALNRWQVEKMVEKAREKKVFLMEALWTRFIPAVQYAVDLVKSDAIGKIKMIHADFGFKAIFDPEKRLYNKALGGGSLVDIGIYPLFLAYLFLGKPKTIKASATFGETGVDEQCGMVLTYEKGEMALLSSSIKAVTNTQAYIFGDKREIFIHGRFTGSQGLTLSNTGREGKFDSQVFSFERSTFGYNYEAAHVMQCLREKRTESPTWSLDDSLNLIDLLDAVRTEAGISYAADASDKSV
ncbi:Gfo/Idh/MocA family protein [Tellurirhabdus bombi]|uniref:Gfo/Idh/MocA family protein n=1 Tax=Tellurirhabdus bombi TaxID=2907205 RepID=UPI001F35D5D9|nr:Gfo/Idh/MocA family oxidoreductase [Tellurirhabdus bombi]